MTSEERIARLEEEIDRWLQYKPKEGENMFINAGAIQSLLLCIQMIRDGKAVYYSQPNDPKEPWQK